MKSFGCQNWSQSELPVEWCAAANTSCIIFDQSVEIKKWSPLVSVRKPSKMLVARKRFAICLRL